MCLHMHTLAWMCAAQQVRWRALGQLGGGVCAWMCAAQQVRWRALGKYRFPLQDGTWDFPGDAVAGKGLILCEKAPARGQPGPIPPSIRVFSNESALHKRCTQLDEGPETP